MSAIPQNSLSRIYISLHTTQVTHNLIVMLLTLFLLYNYSAKVAIGGNQRINDYFIGRVADFAIFDKALSDAEVLSIYNDPKGLEPFLPSQQPSLSPTTVLSSQPSITPSMTPPGINEWFISSSFNVTQEIASSNIIAINLPFNASSREIGVEVFKNDCVTPFESAEYPYFIIDKSVPTSSKSDGFIQFNTTLEMNVTSINETEHWNTFTDGTRGGWAEACVETSLILQDSIDLGNDASPIKVTFKSNVLNISVSLTATFDVDEINVEREVAQGEDVETDYSEFISAYECDEGSVYTPKQNITYNQGDEITICVTDNSGDIVQVEEFVDLIVDQSDSIPYNFIKNGLWNPDITTPVCVDGSTSVDRRVCYAKIRAFALFFQSQNPSDLTIRGTVFVVRDGRRVMRKLRNIVPFADRTNKESNLNISSRHVEENNRESEFKLKVHLTDTNESAKSNGMVEGTATSLISTAIGATGVALLL